MESKDTQFAAVKLPKCLEEPYNTYDISDKIPARCVSHKSKILVVYHKGTVNFPCGIFFHKALSSITRPIVVFCNLSLWEKCLAGSATRLASLEPQVLAPVYHNQFLLSQLRAMSLESLPGAFQLGNG